MSPEPRAFSETLDQQSLMDQVNSHRWYHTIDLPDGASTPGTFDTRRVAERVPWPQGLKGGRCLDIGTCDGFWAFEMERRGAAEVVAIDVDGPDSLDLSWATGRRGNQTPRGSGGSRAGVRFEVARQMLGSRAERLECSVYDLDPRVHGRFDVVFCGSLLIHLRDPVRALERMREVCAGELILVECVDAFLNLFGRRVASARLEPAPGQWWRCNTAGLVAALRTAGFDVVTVSRHFLTPFGEGAVSRGSRWRRPLAAAWSSIARCHALSSVPLLVDALGFVYGTYDVAVRARPSGAQSGEDKESALTSEHTPQQMSLYL
jgi:tRNA (mo5U34)-methyltransferase